MPRRDRVRSSSPRPTPPAGRSWPRPLVLGRRRACVIGVVPAACSTGAVGAAGRGARPRRARRAPGAVARAQRARSCLSARDVRRSASLLFVGRPPRWRRCWPRARSRAHRHRRVPAHRCGRLNRVANRVTGDRAERLAAGLRRRGPARRPPRCPAPSLLVGAEWPGWPELAGSPAQWPIVAIAARRRRSPASAAAAAFSGRAVPRGRRLRDGRRCSSSQGAPTWPSPRRPSRPCPPSSVRARAAPPARPLRAPVPPRSRVRCASPIAGGVAVFVFALATDRRRLAHGRAGLRRR